MNVSGDSDRDDAFEGDESGVFEQMALIQHRATELFGFEPKSKQVEAIRHLLYDKSDLILIAKTGFGKSIVFQVLPMIQEEPKHAGLIIMPLNLLREEQAEKLKTIAGASPFVLNGDTNTGENRYAIGKGVYTHSKLSYQWIIVDKALGLS
jgi:superfamily II DNA helicase RecQ